MANYIDVGSEDIEHEDGTFTLEATLHLTDFSTCLGFYDADESGRTSAHIPNASPEEIERLADRLYAIAERVKMLRSSSGQLVLLPGNVWRAAA